MATFLGKAAGRQEKAPHPMYIITTSTILLHYPRETDLSLPNEKESGRDDMFERGSRYGFWNSSSGGSARDGFFNFLLLPCKAVDRGVHESGRVDIA